MTSPRIAWAVTGSGHYIEECIEYMLTLDNVDLYLSQAGEEVLSDGERGLIGLLYTLPYYLGRFLTE
jgi:flavoprotein